MANKKTNLISEKIWGKKAIHIPNTTDISGANLVSSFVGSYATRTLCLLAKGHKIIMTERNRQATEEIIEYFNKIGFNYISLDNIIFVENIDETHGLSSWVMGQAENIPEFHDDEFESLVPFTATHAMDIMSLRYRKNAGLNVSLSFFLNDKGLLREMLNKKGISVPSTNLISILGDDYKTKAKEIYEQYLESGINKCAIIMPQACSGYGIRRFDSMEGLELILDRIHEFGVDIFLLDPWLDNIGSPAFQICIADKKEDDISLGLSDQILDGHTHLGNKYKSEFADVPAVKEICEQVTEALREIGTRGIVGIDLLIRKVDGEIKPYVLEVNARQTGAIYAGFLAHEIRNGELKPWIGHNNVVVPENFTIDDYHSFLKEKGIDYKFGDEEGVIITCTGNLKHNNKIMILVIADTDNRLNEILNIACSCK